MFQFSQYLTDPVNAVVLADVALKSTIVFGVAAIICWLCRQQSAAVRHRIWVVAIVAALATPLAIIGMPKFSLEILPSQLVQNSDTAKRALSASRVNTKSVDSISAPLKGDMRAAGSGLG